MTPPITRGGVVKVRVAAGLFLIALTCACAGYTPTTSLAYRPIPVEANPRVKPRLVVKPLGEARPPRRYSSAIGPTLKLYIPLLPYVKIPYERLDEVSLQHEGAREERGKPLDRETQHFTQAIASAITDDLRWSGMFSDVALLSDPAQRVDGAYVLDGELRSTELDLNRTAYMLGPVGVLLWVLPIPLGSTTADVKADLRMLDPAGKVVWQEKLEGRGSRMYTMYNSGGRPVSSVMALEIKHYGENDEGVDGDSLWAYHASAIRSGMDQHQARGAVRRRQFRDDGGSGRRHPAAPDPDDPVDRKRARR
jgi:hypothetical protein